MDLSILLAGEILAVHAWLVNFFADGRELKRMIKNLKSWFYINVWLILYNYDERSKIFLYAIGRFQIASRENKISKLFNIIL